jgi:hypothetical protein
MEKIIVRGERCSGTNYLHSLIKSNLNINLSDDLGWKHSYINTFNKKLANNPNYLVIFIFRNPINWIQSFYKNAWHFEKREYGDGFKDITEFIQSKPKQIVKGLNEFKDFDETTELYWERNPFNLEIPKNICQLRNWKNENFLKSSNLLSNVEYIQYEKLYDDPKNYLDYINQKYFNIDYKFKNVECYKGDEKQGFYQKNRYDRLSEENMEFIISNLDWKLEERIGYFKSDIYNYNK